MKTILVDAINGLILRETAEIDNEMYDLLETYKNNKIIVTNANAQEREKFNLKNLPYELFTLEHSPEKTNPEYFRRLLETYSLEVDEVVYLEHNTDAIRSAVSLWIRCFWFNHTKRDLEALNKFLEDNIDND